MKIFWHEWTGGEERGEGLQQSKIKQKISKAGTAENEKLQEREREREREKEPYMVNMAGKKIPGEGDVGIWSWSHRVQLLGGAKEMSLVWKWPADAQPINQSLKF